MIGSYHDALMTSSLGQNPQSGAPKCQNVYNKNYINYYRTKKGPKWAIWTPYAHRDSDLHRAASNGVHVMSRNKLSTLADLSAGAMPDPVPILGPSHEALNGHF